MKKLTKILLPIMLAFVLMISIVPTKTASAVSSSQTSLFETNVMSILNGYSQIKNRLAGSEGEKKAFDYIYDYLENKTELSPKNDSHVSNGIQTFTFESRFTSLYETSRNIIYVYKSSNNTSKTIVLSCHYDSVAYSYNEETYETSYVSSESINGSAGSVATLLAIASVLPNLNLKYNIEIAFFGAGESNNAGAEFFTRGYSQDEKSNIVCSIDLDGVAVGKNMYFYVDENDNALSNLVSNISDENKLKTKKVDVFHLNKYLLEGANDLGYNYMHCAMVGGNYYFKKNNILSIKFFAGDYSNGVILGRCEYSDQELVTYTTNDNKEYISKTFGENSIKDNLVEVYNIVTATISSDGLEDAVKTAKSQNSTFGMFFANSDLAFYLTVVLFIVMIIVAMFVYYKLSIKAYKSRVDVEFVSTVMKISEGVSNSEIDEKTAQTISQIVANDIKKDKALKSKKKKK